MSAVCPAGHTSTADDYCDVCGMPIDAAAVTPGQPPAPPEPPNHAPARRPPGRPALTGPTCPQLRAPSTLPDALFCENCGYDFTTGTMPRPLAPPAGAPARGRGPPDADGGAGVATAAGWRRLGAAGRGELRLGGRGVDRPRLVRGAGEPGPAALPRPADRRAAARPRRCWSGGPRAAATSIPTIDCEADSGVSRRQAQLTTDGQPLVGGGPGVGQRHLRGPASAPLPEDPIPVGVKRELPPTTGSTSAPGPGWSSGRPPTRRRQTLG